MNKLEKLEYYKSQLAETANILDAQPNAHPDKEDIRKYNWLATRIAQLESEIASEIN